MTSDSTPAFEIEKEALKTEIETGIQAGVDHLEAKTAKRKDADKYHNTRHLLKQYRKVAYAIQISEADMNVRMEMEHGTRLSTLEVNAELAGVDLSGSKLEGYARTVIRSKNMLQIIDNALNTVRMDPDHGELMYQVLYLTYFSKKKPANREVILLLAFEPLIRRGMLPLLLMEPASAWPWQKWSKRSWLSAVSVIVGAVLP